MKRLLVAVGMAFVIILLLTLFFILVVTFPGAVLGLAGFGIITFFCWTFLEDVYPDKFK